MWFCISTFLLLFLSKYSFYLTKFALSIQFQSLLLEVAEMLPFKASACLSITGASIIYKWEVVAVDKEFALRQI